jgi:uncharacterized membrane protein YcaP (DUF421 family)
MLFESWQELWRITYSVCIVYPTIILGVRLVGKRAAATMNNFDWIVTVAMGAIVGSAILLKDVVIVEALYAIGLLLGLQFVVTKISVLSQPFSRVVRAEPTLLYYRGDFKRRAMIRERISDKEIRSAVRESGTASMNEVAAVVLESNAVLSVLKRTDDTPISILADVNDFDNDLENDPKAT